MQQSKKEIPVTGLTISSPRYVRRQSQYHPSMRWQQQSTPNRRVMQSNRDSSPQRNREQIIREEREREIQRDSECWQKVKKVSLIIILISLITIAGIFFIVHIIGAHHKNQRIHNDQYNKGLSFLQQQNNSTRKVIVMKDTKKNLNYAHNLRRKYNHYNSQQVQKSVDKNSNYNKQQLNYQPEIDEEDNKNNTPTLKLRNHHLK